MSVTEEQLEQLIEECQNDLDESVEDTTRYSIENALEFYATLEAHCRMRADACRVDLERDGR